MRAAVRCVPLAAAVVALAVILAGLPSAARPAEVCGLPVGVRCLCLTRFCPKPLPCLPRPFRCGCCPAYEGKPLPAVCPVPCACPAGYCPKPLPCPPVRVGCCPGCERAGE